MGSVLEVTEHRLDSGVTLPYGVGTVIERPDIDNSAPLPPATTRDSTAGQLYGWFVENLERPGTWDCYAKESADRLEDAFLHLKPTCNVVVKKYTYVVDMNRMQQMPSSAATASPSTASQQRVRDVKRVPVTALVDPITGEVKLKEVQASTIDPFADSGNDEADDGRGGASPPRDAALQSAAVYVGTTKSGLPLLTHTLMPHKSPIYTMECTPTADKLSAEALAVAEPAGGALALTSGRDLRLLEWSIDSFKVVTSYQLTSVPQRHSVLTATYSPSAKLMIAGLDDRTARLFAIGKPEELLRLEGHTHKVYGAGVMAGEQHAATAGMDCRLKQWDIATGACLRTSIPHQSHIFVLRPHPLDCNFALTAGEDRQVCLHDFRQEKTVVGSFTGHTKTVWDIDWDVVHGQFASCGMDCSVRIFDPRVSTTEWKVFNRHARPVHCVKYTSSCRGFLSSSKDYYVNLCDVTSDATVWRAKGHATTVFRVRYHADKNIMLTAASDASVNVWKWDGGAQW